MLTRKAMNMSRAVGHAVVPVLCTLLVAATVFLLLKFVDIPATKSASEMPAKVMQQNLKPDIYNTTIKSSLYYLQAEYRSNFTPKTKAIGGAIENAPDGYLLIDGDGQLFHIDWRKGTEKTEELLVEQLPYRAPLNGEELDRAAIPGLKRNWFRTLDMLVVEEQETLRIFVSHHVWNSAQKCFAVRISELNGKTENLFSGTSKSEWTTFFESEPCLALKANGHVFMGQESGGRLALLTPDMLLLTLGDLQHDGLNTEEMLAQDETASYGKTLIIGINDGSVRQHSSGHRNPQGLYVTQDGDIWSTEHGPQGGDELNLLASGLNYGWPLVTYGTQYSTSDWPLNQTQGRHEGYAKPVFAWVPSIGVSNLIGVKQDLFSLWQGDLIIASLREKSLFRAHIDEEHVVFVEPININARIRDLVEGHDGRIILWTDDQTLISLQPASDSGDGKLIFEKECGGCHKSNAVSFNDNHHGIGPTLLQIYERPVGGYEDYSYSEELKQLGGNWTADRLDAFIADPVAYVPGTTMQIQGITDKERRASIIRYLRSLQ